MGKCIVNLYITTDNLKAVQNYLQENDLYNEEFSQSAHYPNLCHKIRYMVIDDGAKIEDQNIFKVTYTDVYYLYDIIHSPHYDTSSIDDKFKDMLTRIVKGEAKLDMNVEEIMKAISWAVIYEHEVGRLNGADLALYEKLKEFANQ